MDASVHPTPLRKAAFLDRDGVINLDKSYVHQWADFEFVPGAAVAMQALKQAGYVLVVVTNQSGIARGMYSNDDFASLTRQMCLELAKLGAEPEAVYHCPHHPSGTVVPYAVDCDCRKPAPGMILQAAEQLGLSLVDSIMVGDKPSDIEAARAAGVGRAFKVASDNEESDAQPDAMADGTYRDLSDCVRSILRTTSS